MDNLILHDATRKQLEHFVAHPSHALLLTGPSGVGKFAIAQALAEQILGIQLSSYPYYLTLRPDGLSISIESIRELQKFLLLKTAGQNQIRRVIVIEEAHRLTIEAQNAFLKLLEEPPADTLIILTANSPRGLLPTILSRTQTIAVNTPEEKQLQSLLSSSAKGVKEQQQAYFLSGGMPGLLYALLNDEDHPLLASVAMAKDILQKSLFERLAMVDTISRQKETALGVVEALDRIAQAGLNGAGAKQDNERVKQWHKVRKAALEARDALQRSANAKLALDNLFLCIN